MPMLATPGLARWMRRAALPLLSLPLLSLSWLALSPGVAGAQTGAETHFGNDRLALDWRGDGHLSAMRVLDGLNHRSIAITAPFALHLGDGTVLTPAELTLEGSPRFEVLGPVPDAARLAERQTRHRLTMTFTDREGRFRVVWQMIQVAGAAWIRGAVTVTALRADEAIPRIDLLSATAPGAQVVGRVDGSPVVVGPDYLQFEHPLSKSRAEVEQPTVALWIDRALPLEKGKSVTYSAAVGATAPGQLRRDFQTYLETERAHPYRPFLHYNSWYDIGFMTPYTSDEAVERIGTFCRELSQKRGVKIDSFLFDDGWDDRSGSWNFSKGFPQGFLPLRDAAARCGAAPGIWLSPWGGYDKPKLERIAAAGGAYETIDGGFALSGPRYYQRFHQVALDLVTRQGVNQFKFDGTGNAGQVIAGSAFNSDFDAALALIRDLRAARPDLFINLTTGTYPSPAWLRYADTIWRGGADHDFAGVGPQRERWITYRDAQTYATDVIGGRLFPLNALMLHGIIYAQHAAGLDSDPQDRFGHEVQSFFGSGTQLQELYITPSLLSARNWDTLARAARWSRENAATLQDTHWIGGDPGHLEAYGWAAWSPHKAIITLRNPDEHPQAFLLDVARALELPAGAARRYGVRAVWPAQEAVPTAMSADQVTTVTLAPFEVLTLELTPQG
jgi:hypothetical protein